MLRICYRIYQHALNSCKKNIEAESCKKKKKKRILKEKTYILCVSMAENYAASCSMTGTLCEKYKIPLASDGLNLLGVKIPSGQV